MISSVEICAGAGGQSVGLENAGFGHEALVEIDAACCNTLRFNRPGWLMVEGDVCAFHGERFRGVELLAGGVPCPPFSKAGKQLGKNDERDLFPEAIRLVDEIRPTAVMLENVRGFLDAKFDDYRMDLKTTLNKMGYTVDWKLHNASDYGVPQLRPRVVIVAVKNELASDFYWPKPSSNPAPTVGETLLDLMASKGWNGALEWSRKANRIAPTIVGGSKKHGGPDLGPTRAKRAWAELGVDGMGIANEAPAADFEGMPRLTVKMAARIQGFSDAWIITGKKTPAYRQVGNAFPPPVAEAVGRSIHRCLSKQKHFSMAV
ncbi:MAG: DNA (cytosine-5-)-methyltransferase [Verrucomicrobia bacterium]|nr:MAG: DNA (cytosine-5-)-methyltransferase [Verrucomicrobiota bacterium]